MTRQARSWVRAGLVYLAATFLEVGVWATFATRSFYDDFPGFGRNWVAGDGPYNAHLASDAGVGFLAVGTVLTLAAVWMEHRVIQAALVGATLHGLGHLFFHLNHPNEGLGSLDEMLSNGGLLLGVGVAMALMIAITRQAPHARHEPPTGYAVVDNEPVASADARKLP